MNAASAAAAQCHYQSGRYNNALLLLERQPPHEPEVSERLGVAEEIISFDQDEWIIADERPAKPAQLKLRDELAALSLSARCADVSMCRFRHAINSLKPADDASNELHLWKDAIHANVSYREALSAAASALINSCFKEMQFMCQIKQQLSSALEETMQNRKLEHTSIQKAMKSTAVSILMAGVASAHLHLHEIDEQQQDISVWNVLVQSSIMAGDLLCVRREFMRNISGEKSEINQKRGSLESSLCILNEILLDERSLVALHSFRAALKVAALICDKVILPKVDIQPEAAIEERVKKRQKTQDIEITQQPHIFNESEVWKVTYDHGNATLHSREKIIDALSFNSALIHNTQKTNLHDLHKKASTLFLRREVCFSQSILLESKMKALFVHDTSSEPLDDAFGFARKIRTCTRSLELTDSIVSVTKEDKQNIVSDLEQLVISSTSRFACEMRGCIHARQGEYSRAIEMFQLALERQEESNYVPSYETDVENHHEMIGRRIASNMASCFIAYGAAEVALEILLEIWPSLNESNRNLGANFHPKSLLLTNQIKKIDKETVVDCTNEEMKLLWMIYHVASFVGDWSTSLQATELMKEHSRQADDTISRVRIGCADIFSRLQCRQELGSQEIADELSAQLDAFDPNHPLKMAVSILADLYAADISLSIDSDTEYSSQMTPFTRTSRVMNSLNSYTTKMISAAAGIRSLYELRVLVLNNLGVCCLIDSDSAGALRHFREALDLLASTNESEYSLLMPIHFNFALLLLQDGRIDESAKTWLSFRGHLETWESAKRSDIESLSKLRKSHLLAMNRHGMVMAKRNASTVTSVFFDLLNVTPWVAPVIDEQEWQEESPYINGVDAAQICTLDFVLIKHALSSAEKKSNNIMRRSAHFGY